MICNRTQYGWEIIYQRAHALLAAKCVENWRRDQRPRHWLDTLNAIAQHDNGWQEWEDVEQLTPTGTPRTFDETELEDIVAQARRVLQRARHQSLWSSLLISRHISQLYEPKRGEHEELDALLDDQPQWRESWRQVLEIETDELEQAYAILLWGDTLSLVLCRQALPFSERAIEIGAGPDGTRYDARQLRNGVIRIEPWPYEVERFPVGVDTYELQQLTFDSSSELEQALREAHCRRRTWELVAP